MLTSHRDTKTAPSQASCLWSYPSSIHFPWFIRVISKIPPHRLPFLLGRSPGPSAWAQSQPHICHLTSCPALESYRIFPGLLAPGGTPFPPHLTWIGFNPDITFFRSLLLRYASVAGTCTSPLPLLIYFVFSNKCIYITISICWLFYLGNRHHPKIWVWKYNV